MYVRMCLCVWVQKLYKTIAFRILWRVRQEQRLALLGDASAHHIQIKVYMCVYVLWLNQVATGDYANIPAYAVGVAAEDM